MKAPEIPKSSIIDTKYGPIEYVVVGEGEPILAIHGGGGGYDQGVVLYSLFADAGYSIICPSRPGYLRTPLSSGKEIVEQVDLCAELLSELGIDKVGVVGGSAGGALTYEFAIRHSDRTKAIVVIDGISMKYDYEKDHKPVGKISETLFLSNTGMKLMSILKDIVPKTVIKQILDIEGDLTPQELKERTQHIAADPIKFDFMMGIYNTLYPYKERKIGLWNDVETEAALDKIAVSKIKCPALILHSSRDNDVVMAHADYAVSEIPDAEFYLIEGGTHFGFWVSDYASEAQKKAVAFFQEHL